MQLPRIVISGLSGGSGKTLLSLGLTRAFRQRGRRVMPAKKGPAYIDAAWLGIAAGRPAANLDPYFLPLEELPVPLGEGDCLRRDDGGRWQPAPEETKRRREALFRRARALGKQSP